jgi:hypothetical protein
MKAECEHGLDRRLPCSDCQKDYEAENAPSLDTVESIVGIQVGDRVQCYVYVCGEAVPMHQGIVTEWRDGYYMVDRMSLHGGRPWIVAERHVKKVDANAGNESLRG